MSIAKKIASDCEKENIQELLKLFTSFMNSEKVQSNQTSRKLITIAAYCIMRENDNMQNFTIEYEIRVKTK